MERADKINDFKEITKTSVDTANSFLSTANFDLDNALYAYLMKYTPITDTDESEDSDDDVKRFESNEECEKLIDASDDEQVTTPKTLIENPMKVEPFVEEPNVPRKRRILIDGTNVAMSFAQSTLGKFFNKNKAEAFSVEGLQICLKYFEGLGFEAKATVPNYRFNQRKSSNPELLKDLLKDGKLIALPSKSYEDEILLQSAVKLNAAVVSNDYFRDLQKGAYTEVIFKRTIKYNWIFREFIVAENPFGRDGPSLKDILYYTLE